jgi:hypothetical protein
MDDGRAGVCLFPTYIYVSKTLTNDENDGDLQQQHVMDDVGGGELGSGRWRHSRGLRSVRHGRRYHVLLAYVKAANYSELVCESPMLLQYGKDQREDHGGKNRRKGRDLGPLWRENRQFLELQRRWCGALPRTQTGLG